MSALIAWLQARRISWACSMDRCGQCDGTADGPGTGNCNHYCHGG